MRTHVFSLYVAASTSQVWTALTRPDVTPHYYFGLRAESEWAEGSTVSFRAPGLLVATGEVVRAERGHLLMHSLADACAEPPDPDASDLRPATWVSWELEPREDGVTRVRLLVDELESDSDEEADETELVWSRLLSNLKTLLETGAGLLPRQRGAVMPESG
ncbi:SRPBCC domain-containing protein [Motilibacter deserti]|uniref:Activator of Hsp90 ATPase homologue 1/2-like C-terminal domain-containing protein n=1 Tax=Motilibacter deserti TaxID=2714956 RepID=A0ABX0GRZ8_9ACTN|nr:SRPBCC domain-containing protein [Motilibacter deserti]NHC12624.1 hypothetical protein [Motilibacter deserti]